MTPRKRKILTILLGFIALVAITLIALPLWFPWVLAPALRHFGVHYGAYQRISYAEFALIDVTFTEGSLDLRARRIQMLIPTMWLWHQQRRHTDRIFLEVTDWKLDQQGDVAAKQENPRTQISFPGLLGQIDARMPGLRNWLPRALLKNGVVSVGKNQFEFPRIEWHNGRLQSDATRPGLGQRVRLDADFTTISTWPLRVRVEPLDLEAAIQVGRTADTGTISGTVLWRTNKLIFEGQFPRQGWLPSEGMLSSSAFRIPAAALNLRGYSDLSGSLFAQWHQGQLSLKFQALAEPLLERIPRVAMNVNAHGTTNSLTIDQFQVATPFLQANLSPGVQFGLDGQLRSPAATLQFDGDLNQQRWIAMSGKLLGEVQFRPGTRKYPEASFQMAGSDLSGFGIQVQQFTSAGTLLWPRLEVQHVAIRLPENATVQASMSVNLSSRFVSEGKLQLIGSNKLPLLPPECSFDQLSGQAEFEGALDDLSHSVHLDVTGLRLPQVQPSHLSLASRGRQFRFDQLNAQLDANTSSLKLAGSASLTTNGVKSHMTTLTLIRDQQQVFALAKPLDLTLERLHPSPPERPSHWLVRCSELDWRGEDRRLALNGSTVWPSQGSLSVNATAISVSLFQDFVSARLPELAVNDLNLSAGWTNGPAVFQLSLNSKLTGTNAMSLAAEVKATGGNDGVALDRLTVSDGTAAFLSGQGSLPITIDPARTGAVVRVERRQPIEFRATTRPNPSFWNQISQWIDLSLQEPSVDLAISGTLDSPKGHIAASVASLEVPSRNPTRKLPRLDKLTANVEIVPGLLRLHDLQVFVEDQPIRATGEVPFRNDFSARLQDLADLNKATARVQIDRAQLAPFAPFFPKVISSQGELTLDLSVQPGLKLDGALSITNVATRPLMPFGAVQDISARLNFAGHSVRVENFTGFFGSQPLIISGTVDFAKRNPETKLPEFDFRIRGDNIPLARQPELILRSDLDLTVSNVTNKIPIVGGLVRLRDSFYLADLKLLIPGRVATPDRRPPYFSIETHPFAQWQLAVHVEGDRFLKVRSPFFRGDASANLSLQGTLREPAAIGNVIINDSTIHFPFANLRMDRGLVSLTSDNLYRPQLQVIASTRSFGYDIRMEVSGFADDPVVQFSSTPPLSSEQIVLFLTTGAVPGNQTSFSNQQRAGRMALFVGKGLFSKLSGGEGNADRLMVQTGEAVTESGKQTYSVEYKLTDDWSLVGEYDRFSAFNAGVKWRFYSK